MNRFFSHIKFLTFIAILTGFALASVHHHDGTIQSTEIIIELGDSECSMCDATVKMDHVTLSISSLDLIPISTVSDGMVLTAKLPFERLIKDRAPPSRA